jgi:hypothetical protein
MNMLERTQVAQQIFNEWHGSPLIWGSLDCANLASRLVEIITGKNPIADWPSYGTEQQAFKAIRAMGFKSLQDAVTEHAKPLDGPLFAIAGDIVAIKAKRDRMPALGVCLGPDAVLCFYSDLDDSGEPIAGTSRARRLDMQFAVSAWRVG